MTRWDSEWRSPDCPLPSPYIHWAMTRGGLLNSGRPTLDDTRDPDLLVPAATMEFQKFAAVNQSTIPKARTFRLRRQSLNEAVNGPGKSDVIEELLAQPPSIPAFADNRHFDVEKSWLPSHETLQNLDIDGPDTPIIGVIDRGIALGHHRSRRTVDKTRILSAWQQISSRSGLGDIPDGSQNLPFGLDFTGEALNQLLKRHTLDSGVFDEDGFNAAVGAAEFRQTLGHRELSRDDSHGTHVLDLAGGADLGTGEDDMRDKTRFMVVNLPDRSLVGAESRNLEYFVLLGLLRMIGFSDAVWDCKHAKDVAEGHPKGYPLVVNLSFAKHAGPLDGFDLVSRFLNEINEYRLSLGRRPVLLVTPAGNNNLDRGHALKQLAPLPDGKEAEPMSVDWRLVPDDQSANFVEVWAQLPPGVNANPGLSLQVIAPNGQASTADIGQGQQYTDFGETARIYCDVIERDVRPDDDDGLTRWLRFVICTAPTVTHDPAGPGGTIKTAPSGRWQISVRNLSATDLMVRMNVQVDQSLRLDGMTGHTTYFDDPNYRKYDTAGRLLDTFSSPFPDEGTPPVDHDIVNTDGGQTQPNRAVVQRKGTMNTLSRRRNLPGDSSEDSDRSRQKVLPGALIAAAHVAKDGTPSWYSSTGLGRNDNMNTASVTQPTVSFPADDSPTQQGVMSAGARDGSVAVLSGTSFASAQLTRWIARNLLKSPDLDYFDLLNRLNRDAVASEADHKTWRFASELKVGMGRLPAETQRRPVDPM